MMKIGVDTASAVQTLNKAGKELDRERLLKTIGAAILHWIDENFRVQGKEKKWKQLSKNTVAGRRKGSKEILQDTGRMKQSILPVVKGDEVFIGTAEARAKYHHFGTSPYEIRPVYQRALSFTVAGGKKVFVKRVDHPGLATRPIFPSDGVAEKLAVRTVEAYVEKMIGTA